MQNSWDGHPGTFKFNTQLLIEEDHPATYFELIKL